jgi:hypothetical protein
MPFNPPTCAPVGGVTFADYAIPPSGTNFNKTSVATLRSIGLSFYAPYSGNLWPILVVRVGGTYSGATICVRLLFEVG